MTIDLSQYTTAERARIIKSLTSDKRLDVTTSWPVGHHLRGTGTVAVEIDRRYSKGSPQDGEYVDGALDLALSRRQAVVL